MSDYSEIMKDAQTYCRKIYEAGSCGWSVEETSGHVTSHSRQSFRPPVAKCKCLARIRVYVSLVEQGKIISRNLYLTHPLQKEPVSPPESGWSRAGQGTEQIASFVHVTCGLWSPLAGSDMSRVAGTGRMHVKPRILFAITPVLIS